MSQHDHHDASADGLEVLQQRIAYLQEALAAVSSGGVDAVVIGDAEHQEVYALTSADRPYRVLVENMGEGAVTVSERGVVLYANPQLARLLGVERDGMVGRDVADYVGRDQHAALDRLVGRRSEGTRRAELTVSRPDGTMVPFLVAATDLDIEGVLVQCLVFTDLTMQKIVERQLAEEAAQNERQRVAREVNDTIVQGLVTAEMALDLGRVDYARDVIAATSSHARGWIGELAGELSGDHQLQPGQAVRRTAANPGPDPA